MANIKTSSVTEAQLRFKRISIYRKMVSAVSLIRSVNGKVLHPAPAGLRHSNFLKFVELYFLKVVRTDNNDSMSDNFGWATKLTTNSDGYKAFQRFSLTDYGSYVIKEMLGKKSKYKGFVVRENTSNGAHADYDFISLPKKFPAGKYFKTSKQEIYDLAIIYHEFSHTMVFRPNNTKDKNIDIYDERNAVINFENPVRIRMGYEPRYSYSLSNKFGVVIQTINIITGIPTDKELVVDKNDPTKLVSPTSKDALR